MTLMSRVNISEFKKQTNNRLTEFIRLSTIKICIHFRKTIRNLYAFAHCTSLCKLIFEINHIILNYFNERNCCVFVNLYVGENAKRRKIALVA